MTDRTQPDTRAPSHTDAGTSVAASSAPTGTFAVARKAGTPKGAKRVDSQPYLHGKGWAIRRSYKGRSIFLSGFKTPAALKKELNRRLTSIDNNELPVGAGAPKTSLAQALQDYGMARLPFLKGAEQEARRINAYLRPAGLRLLNVEPLPNQVDVPGKSGKGAHFQVTLVPHSDERVIPKGLGAHRKALLNANAKSDKRRAVLASTAMADVTRDDVQGFIDQLSADGSAPATVGLERSVLRVVFNYAFVTWKWTELQDNPASRIKMPPVNNARSRVLSYDEQAMLDQALKDCRNQLVEPTLVLLRETAMRASEPLEEATWKDVNWSRNVLKLRDGKTGQREVPLSPLAIEALQTLHRMNPDEADGRIIRMSYEALKGAWRRALERAGIDDLHIHDLRHTAATRMALETGNIFLVKVLGGWKNWDMLDRYVNVGPDDVVKVMHGKGTTAPKTQAQPSPSPHDVAVAAEGGAPMDLGEDRADEMPQSRTDNVFAFPVRRRA